MNGAMHGNVFFLYILICISLINPKDDIYNSDGM